MTEPQTVVTSSWSTPLPEGYARIGISRGPPRGQRGYRTYRALAPGPWLWSVTEEEFCRRYLAQLGFLDPRKVLADLTELAGHRMPALLCFEQPPPDPRPCHRGLVSAWFAETVGVIVPEYGHETKGSGWSHPKISAMASASPQSFRP